jgi:signal transduction histidine kinase
VRGEAEPEGPLLGRWFAKAEHDQVFVSYPMEILPGEQRSGPKIVLLGTRWAVTKAWREGSPEVEQSLRNHFGPGRPFRVVLLKDGDEARKDLKPQAWGQEPNLQGDPWWGTHSAFSVQFISNEFPGWTLTAVPFKAEGQAVRLGLRLQFALAAAAALVVGLSMVLALYFRARARRKATLDADRMASMTHSLKTPLAILKFRCDTLRLGRLPPDQLDSQLIQIGEEADRLSGIIENALMAIQGPSERGPQGTVSPAWIRGVVDDLAPAFVAEDRDLVLVCAEASGKAALPSLQAALFTLVENALYHGMGTVTVETGRKNQRFIIKVSDQGPGLDSMDLRTLGRPFMRIRDKGKEGFRKEGQGLGLSLLIKVVEREGWGLSFASEADHGLCATLEILPEEP